MRAFTVNWNPNKDETTISFSEDFLESAGITKADILKDALFDLENLYNKIVMEEI